MSRIVQVANFVAPHSGGIRTVLANLADGYARHGHEVVQIVPGKSDETTELPWGRLVTVAGRAVPKTGYRVLTSGRVCHTLDTLAPDRLEVHDRTTLRPLGEWARTARVPSCVISHERLDRLLTHWTHAPRISRKVADRSNAKLAAAFDSVVCTTAWAAEEFDRMDIGNVQLVALGVDTDTFTPHRNDDALRTQLAFPDESLIVTVVRLSPEKLPGLAVDTAAELLAQGKRVRLVVAGDGPLLGRVRRQAGELPVRFLGHVDGAARVAALQATADVVIAPGPLETFGLAAVEALACGTPVVVNAASALPAVIGPAGLAAPATPAAFATAVQQLLARPEEQRREAARARALDYSWSRTVERFLAVHGLASLDRAAAQY